MYKITMTLVLGLTSTCLFAEDIKVHGVKGSYEQLPMKVLEVVEIDEDGFVFTGYYVDYKGKKIMVSSMMGGEASKVGEEITVMVQKIEAPGPEKVTKTFMFMVMPNTGKMMRDMDLKREKIRQELDDAKDSAKPVDAKAETKAPKKEF